MNVSEEEEEIKIEYFESFETDPLCENIAKCDTNVTKQSNIPNENINQQVSNSKNYKKDIKKYKNTVCIIGF